jgi:pyridoxamine 5'-phosphate oxidase
MTTHDAGPPPDDPFARFAAAFAEAQKIPRDRLPEPNAFTLATVGADGAPSARIVLLKDFDERGFVFYTNYESRKGRELLALPRAAMCFHWPLLEVQIRVEGSVEQVAEAEADAYFASRPRGSQIGAWASAQSRPLASATALDARVAEIEKQYHGQPVPRPPHWSGFRIVPARIEFWRGMPSRLHRREVYTRSGAGWTLGLLNP